MRRQCSYHAASAMQEQAAGQAGLTQNPVSRKNQRAARRSVPTPTWVRDDNTDGWGFEWKGPKGFHCVRPDFDIVVPMYAPYTRKHLVSPFAHPRNISVLLRFAVDKTDGKYLIANHGAAGISSTRGSLGPSCSEHRIRVT